MKKMKSQKAITLIALIVTIIVLLILAGISIAVLTGENGILSNAQKAKLKTEEGTVDEAVKLATTTLNMEIIKNKTKYSSFDATKFIDTTTDGTITVDRSCVQILKDELQDSKYTVTGGTNEITIVYKSTTLTKSYLITLTPKNGILSEYEMQNLSIDFAITGTKLNTENLSLLPEIESLPQVTAGTRATEKSRYTDSQNNIAVIPSGFKVSTVAGENNVDTGLVIIDDNENEFVWIPVDIDQTLTLKVKSNEDDITDIKLLDPKGQQISVGSFSGKEYPLTNINPTYNGEYEVQVSTVDDTQTKKLVVRSLYAMDAFNDWYSTDEAISMLASAQFYDSEEDLLSDYGATSNTDFAYKYANSKLGTETENYAENVNDNGGFYIGRYEAGYESGNVLSKADAKAYGGITRDDAISVAESKYVDMCHLPTGAAWDRTLGFLINTNAKTISQVAGDSKGWGNYDDSEISEDTGSLARTAAMGIAACANNIYDLAGNVEEWTSEMSTDEDDTCVARRGFLFRRWCCYAFKCS